MDQRIKEILTNEYYFNIQKLNILEGGFCPDETYLLITSDQMKYVVKYIEYSSSLEHLQSILKFQNFLYKNDDYPCSQIILSNKEELVISDNNRFLFVQTFIEGIEPTNEILDQYLYQMGRLLAIWRIASREYSMNEENQELTDKWWKQMENIDDPFLLENFIQCKNHLINLNGNFEIGIIHNDFHTNNSLVTKDNRIFIIDFVDACRSVFIADLATSLFHLLINQQNGIYRAKLFLQGYQQIIQLTSEEINILDRFVQFKLTLSIIEDLRDSNDINEPFIQSCFHLLRTLNNHSDLVKNLLEEFQYPS
jgi:Ser/Thr protein kinase RdoA (MazF antagonist)